MQSKTLQANVGDSSASASAQVPSASSGQVKNEEVEEKVEAAPDTGSKNHGNKGSMDQNDNDQGISLQTKLRNQFKAIEELKEKKKVLDDILKEAEEQNAVIQEILEEIDGQKDLLKSEREQFKGEHAETYDKLKEVKKELKDENELFSDMLIVSYERGEEVLLTDKAGNTLVLKLQAKLAVKK